MSHRQFTVAYETVSLDLLISTPKTLRILLVHKIRETRFQLLLFNWAWMSSSPSRRRCRWIQFYADAPGGGRCC